MKFYLPIFAFTSLAFFTASAQVSVEVTMDQGQFLPSETMPVAVHITNRSGESLHLGANPDWLTFSVESADGFVVVKNAEVPVLGEFDLGSSEVATKRVDIAPYFVLSRPGRYRVIATLRIRAWNSEINSSPKNFDVIDGARLWSQDFGVPSSAATTNGAPEVRKYTLEEANYLKSQLRLYVEVSDESESHVFKVVAVGRMVSFSAPETQLDRLSNLHVLWQSGASVFTYVVVNPNGELLRQETYDYVSARPRLGVDDNGNITVIGGVRRVKPDEIPAVKLPDELPAPAKP
jgi:hypothetical protein